MKKGGEGIKEESGYAKSGIIQKWPKEKGFVRHPGMAGKKKNSFPVIFWNPPWCRCRTELCGPCIARRGSAPLYGNKGSFRIAGVDLTGPGDPLVVQQQLFPI